MARRALAIAAVVMLACSWPEAARAADHVVGGTQLTLRRSAGSAALSLTLRDPAVAIPAPGSADDPSSAGLVVTLFGRGSDMRAQLFAAPGLGRPGWKVRTTPRVTYAYRNPATPPGSPLPSLASLRDGAGLRVRAKSSGLTLSAPEGAVAVRIDMGATRVCALFDGDAVRRDEPGRFVARDADASGLTSCDDDALAGLGCEESLSCGGSCPAGEECASLGGFPEPSCGCLPAGSTPCGGVFPSCGDGDCPTGTTCYQDTFFCCGDVAIPHCACLSEPPPEPCPGGCPDGWTCVGPAPNFPAQCLPPFCNDGAGAPVCSGTCTLEGTGCTAIAGVCLCLDPCLGGDAYPACGGGCSDAKFTCRGIEGKCVCVP